MPAMSPSARSESLIGSLDLVYGAFKEAGFLADANRPLKVCHSAPLRPLHSYLFFFFYTRSYTAHSSIRHTAARRPVSAAPQGASPFPSSRSPRLWVIARTSARGVWMSCRYVRWEAGHMMGRMCESQGAIFDLSPALLHDHSLLS